MKGYLPPDDWERFLALFFEIEHAKYYDVREQFLVLLGKLDERLAATARANNPALSEIVILALAKLP